MSAQAPGNASASNPIGIFDSGVGGLSVLLEVRRELPGEDLLYVADSGHAPYGDKPADFIERRAASIVDFFSNEGAKSVVVACNTATGIAIESLRTRWPMPIVGIEPAIKPAVAITKTGVIGVLATSQTIASARFARLSGTFASGVEIIAQPCPGLVEQIESGDLSSDATRALVAGYVRPLLERRVDTLVLGCTHFPPLTGAIRTVVGTSVRIVESAVPTADALAGLLGEGQLASDELQGVCQFLVTDGEERFARVGPTFLGRAIASREIEQVNL